jgi:capsid protein
VKEAQAAQIRMDAGISTLEDECAEQGLDWEEVLEQRARERSRMEELGLLEAAVASSQRPIVTEKEENAA